MPTRLLSSSVLDEGLPIELAPGSEVVEGSPTAAAASLHTSGGLEVGLWEVSAGVVRDVEASEIFLVLSGRGTLTFEDETLDLAPGVLVRLREGDRTTWSVSEPIRKLYITDPQ